MNLEAINKWLEEEYGCSYTKLEELHDFYFEKYCDLKQKNKILKENAENNDKVVDKVNWKNQLLKKENKQLKDNWNKLKEWVDKSYDYYSNNADYIGGRLCFTDMKNNMRELEQGGEIND